MHARHCRHEKYVCLKDCCGCDRISLQNWQPETAVMQSVGTPSCPAMPVAASWLGQAPFVAMQASCSGDNDVVKDGASSYHDSPQILSHRLSTFQLTAIMLCTGALDVSSYIASTATCTYTRRCTCAQAVRLCHRQPMAIMRAPVTWRFDSHVIFRTWFVLAVVRVQWD